MLLEELRKEVWKCNLDLPKNGLVKRINTSVQAKVAPGDILVEIEEETHE